MKNLLIFLFLVIVGFCTYVLGSNSIFILTDTEYILKEEGKKVNVYKPESNFFFKSPFDDSQYIYNINLNINYKDSFYFSNKTFLERDSLYLHYEDGLKVRVNSMLNFKLEPKKGSIENAIASLHKYSKDLIEKLNIKVNPFKELKKEGFDFSKYLVIALKDYRNIFGLHNPYINTEVFINERIDSYVLYLLENFKSENSFESLKRKGSTLSADKLRDSLLKQDKEKYTVFQNSFRFKLDNGVVEDFSWSNRYAK